MTEIWNIVVNLFSKNGLVAAFLIVGIMTVVSNFASKLTRGRLHASAIAIFLGLVLAYIGGAVEGGTKGLSDIAMFGGVGLLGSSMMRDFTIVSTAFGAKFSEIKKCGLIGILSLVIGVILSFIVGALFAAAFGFTTAEDVATIGAGACTFVVGPVTGEAVGASSDAITISVAVGVIKSVAVMLITPVVAKKIGLTTPRRGDDLRRPDGHHQRLVCRSGGDRSQTRALRCDDRHLLYGSWLSAVPDGAVFCYAPVLLMEQIKIPSPDGEGIFLFLRPGGRDEHEQHRVDLQTTEQHGKG